MTTFQDATDVLEDNDTVDNYDIKDDGIRFWVSTEAYKEHRQAVEDDLESLEGVTLELEKTENDWYWFFITIDSEQ